MGEQEGTIATVEQRTISDEGARRCVAAARAQATELGLAVSIAVVDATGVLKAFVRVDGAPLLSVVVAQRKAYTAVAAGMPTQALYDGYRDEPVLLGLIGGLPGAAVIGGGVPLYHGDALVGAVGVSGGSVEQDVTIAEAAAAAVAGG